jgi:hypothetical protein
MLIGQLLRLVLFKKNSRRGEIKRKLKAILTLYDKIENRSGSRREMDLRNLEEDLDEMLSRNSHLTGIEVA